MLQIAHFYVKSGNMGDLGSSQGIKMILRSINPNITFIDFPIIKKKVSWFEINKLNKQFDAVIIGGGGLFYNREHYSSKPKCIWGVGVNQEYSKKDKWIINEETIRAIAAFAQSTKFIGVRDNLTIGFFKNYIPVSAKLVPCPSMFMLKDLKGTVSRKKSVAINLTHRSVDIHKLMSAMSTVVNYLRDKSYEPIFIVHVLREDRKLFSYFEELKVKIFVPSSPENLMEFYKNQQFLIGMRGHSLIYATGANIPMIALSYNKKCDGHIDLLGLNDYLIKYDNIYDPDLIINKVDMLIYNYDKIKKTIQEKFHKFWEMNYNFGYEFLNSLNKVDRY